MKYMVYFNSDVDYPPIEVRRLDEAMNGFWLDKNGDFTKYTRSKFWIPPSAIRYIEKIPETKDDREILGETNERF
jgi:hypothetical protein